jgi:tRNA(Ile)-lysidine synthase
MQKLFAQKLEDMRRLIDDSRSASFPHCQDFTDGVGDGQEANGVSVPVRYLLAVSGGMDSMCLLDLFSKAVPSSDYAVAHCNFSLRGEESDGDQAMVQERAAALGTEVFVQRFDTESYAREKGVSIEMAARELRYGWFAELCSEHGFDAVVVAHNANDNAETLMLNLLRGTGLNGLHGMAEVTEVAVNSRLPEVPSSLSDISSASEKVVTVFRPLLEFTRKQIEGYVMANRVPYRHDSSNFESDYKRNRVRNEVFPVFEKINPSFLRTLNREIGYFAEAGDIVEQWCDSQMPKVTSCVDGNLHIDTSALLSVRNWHYLLYHILSPYGFNQQTLASIESLLTSSRTIPGKRFESHTHTLLTARNCLIVLPHTTASVNTVASVDSLTSAETLTSADAEMPGHKEFRAAMGGVDMPSSAREVIPVRGPGIYNFNSARFSVEVITWTSDRSLKQPSGTIILDADKLPLPFVCRRWRQGDWLVPLGMKGKKKVSDLFADLKYDTLAKESSIIMVDTQTEGLAQQQHIAGVLGVRIDDRYKVTESTRNVIRLTVLDNSL